MNDTPLLDANHELVVAWRKHRRTLHALAMDIGGWAGIADHLNSFLTKEDLEADMDAWGFTEIEKFELRADIIDQALHSLESGKARIPRSR